MDGQGGVSVVPASGGLVNYYKRHIGDYAAKAGHLSALEHGVYTLLIDAYYNREEAPTRAEAVRWARARTPGELAAVDAVLGEFFTEQDGRFTQSRIEEELAAFHAKQEVNRQLGAKGGQAKRNAKRIASETLSECVAKADENQQANAKPSHKPLAISQEEAKEKSGADAPADPKKAFWDAAVACVGENNRARVGKLAKQYGEEAVAKALAETAMKRPADPMAYVARIVQKAESNPWDGAL